jgi:hypothetical protein
MASTVTPTVVVGIGKGGNRMMSALEEVVTDQGQRDDFKFIGIDSNGSDLRSESPADVHPLELTVPDAAQQRSKDVSRYSYLRDGIEIGTQGSDRTRSIARYYVDNYEMYPDIREELDEQIAQFYEQRKRDTAQQVKNLHIWVVNSLGGGTGSGVFPIVAAILSDLKDRHDATLNGLASLPRLDDLEGRDSPPEQRRFHANAYAALAELQKVVNYDDDPAHEHYPLEIDLESGRLTGDITSETITIDQNPFDLYWLIGFDEESNSASYRTDMNRIAATGIFYYANQSSTENFPDNQQFSDVTLYALTSADLRAPVGKARRFVDLQNEIDACEEIRSVLSDEVDDHKASRQYVAEAWATEYDLQSGEDELDLAHVMEDLVTTCQLRAQEADPHAIVNDEFDLEETLDGLVNNVREQGLVREPERILPVQSVRDPASLVDVDGEAATPSDRIREGEYDEETVFDQRDVVAWFYCDQVYKKLAEDLTEDKFVTKVSDIWQRHTPKISDDYSHLSDVGPEQKWLNGMEDWLNERWHELDQELSETSSIRVLRKRRLKERRQRIDQEINTLATEYENYKNIKAVRDLADSKRKTAKKALSTAEDDLKSIIEGKQDHRDDVRESRVSKEEQRTELASTLTDPDNTSTQPHVALEMAGLDSLDAESLEDAETIASLVRDNKVDGNHAALALHQLLSEYLNDPVHDVIHDSAASRSVDDILGVLAHEENLTPPDDYDVTGLLDLRIQGRRDIGNLLNDADYYQPGEMHVESADGFSLRFFKWFAPVQLANTSEFGTIDQLLAEDAVSDEFGGDYTAEDVLNRFAYPELFSDDDPVERRIREHFDGLRATQAGD